MGASRGRLYGKNVLDGVFRAAPDEDLFLGELLVAVDEQTGRRYLFRVVDVSYCARAPRAGMGRARSPARSWPPTHGAKPVPTPCTTRAGQRTASPQCRCPATSRPRRPRDAGVRKAQSLPEQFSKVVSRRPANSSSCGARWATSTIAPPAPRPRRSSTSVSASPVARWPTHVGIFDTTGMGKSNLMKGSRRRHAGRGALRRRAHRPHGEYAQGAPSPRVGQERLRTGTRRANLPTRAAAHQPRELTVDDLRTAYDWSRPQEEALFELERHYGGTGLAWLLPFSQMEELPGFRDVELNGRVALNTRQVVHRRARRIANLQCISADSGVGRPLDRRRPGDGPRRARRRQRAGVDRGGARRLVAGASTVMDRWSPSTSTSRRSTSACRSCRSCSRRRNECCRAAVNGSSNVFPASLARVASSRSAITAITQQPKLLDAELLSQFNTYFVLGLADERDRNILKSSAKQDLRRRPARSRR